MSLTPLYPHKLAFHPKAVLGNKQEDVTKVEELEDKRLLAALVASLDTKLDYKKIAYYHGTTVSAIASLLRPALLEASMLIRGVQVEAEQRPSSPMEPTAKGEFVPVPSNTAHGMKINGPHMYIAQLCTAGQSKEKMEIEGEMTKGMVMMLKRLEGFEIGWEMAFKTGSVLGKRRRGENEL